MALAVADRVRETTTTTGTGTITLAGAVTGYQSFSAIGNGNTTYYTINAGSQWEVGIGTYTASGTTLSRDTVLASSNAGSLVNFSAGTKDVFATYPAGKAVYQDASGNVGIGTTPTARLDVFASAGGEILFRNSGGIGRLFADGSATYVGSASNHPLIFNTNATERMRILTGGDVGIGTSSPNAKLTVAGAITSYQAGVTDQIIFTPQAAGSGALLLAVNEANNAYRQMTIDGSPVVINTAGTEKVRVTSGGEVGIGLTPSHALDVYSAANGIIRVGGGSGTNQGAAFYVKSAGSSSTLAAFGDRARIFGGTPDQLVSIFTSASPLTFDVNGSERARFDTSSNLGIGTSSPGVKLDVVGGIRGQALDATGTPALFSASGGSVLYYNGAGVGVVRAYSNSGGAAGALTFNASGAEDARVDSSGNFLVGITGQIYPTANRKTIEVNGTSQSLFGMGVGGTGAAYILHDGTDMDIWQSRNGYMRFGTNGSERMRIDSSGNVLVGTTTAGSAGFTVNQSSNISFNEAAGQSLATIFRQASSGDTVIGSGVARSSNANAFASSYSSAWARSAVNVGYGTIKFYTAAEATVAVGTDTTMNERMRIDIFGNVGIGVTPSASDLPTIQSTYGIISGNAQINIAQNAYYSGGWKYTGTAAATLYFQGSGAHNWQIAASGTAGAAISFTQAMTLNTSGNLGIGTTGPSYKLDVAGQARAYNTASTYGELQLLAQYTGTAGPLAVGQGSDSTGYVVNTANAALVFGNNGTERMRITASGDVGIGTTGPGVKFEVNSTSNYQAYFKGTDAAGAGGLRTLNSGGSAGVALLTYGPSYAGGSVGSVGANGSVVVQTGNAPMFVGTDAGISQPLYLGTNGAERMRITSGGNVGIGTTSPSLKFVVSNGGAAGLEIDPTALASSPIIQSFNRSGAAYTQLGFNALQYVWQVSGNSKLWVDTNGSLGIGATPSAALGSGTVTFEVLSGTNGEAMFRSSGDVSAGAAMQVFIGGSNNIRSAYIGYGGINNVFDVWNSLAGALTFGTSNSERMRIASGGNVGIGTSSPNAAARLDVSSTTSGFLPPRMTTTQRDAISSPPNGLVLYNSTTDKLQVRAAGAWVDLH